MCYVCCFYLKANALWCPSPKICSAKRMCLKDIMRLSTFSATAGFSGRFNFLYVPVCFREKNSLCYLAPTFGTEVRMVSARERLCVNLVTWIWKKLTQWRCMPRIVCLVTYNIISINYFNTRNIWDIHQVNNLIPHRSGYAFINFVDLTSLELFRDRFHGFRQWGIPGTEHVGEVCSCERHQGLSSIIQYYRNNSALECNGFDSKQHIWFQFLDGW